jgi:hypothetical protein
MEGESRIAPVLGHLAWLAERIDDDINRGRAHDAALLTYNAAVMLQWRFTAPVSYADTIQDPALRSEAAELINDFVNTSRRMVVRAKQDPAAAEDETVRKQLTKKINKVTKNLPRLLLASNPVPERRPEFEEAANLRQLMAEFLTAHKDQYSAAIAKGKALGAKGGTGPEAALNEALAAVIYSQDAAETGSMLPELQSGLSRIAAGFFKTAVDMQPDDMPPEEKRLWRRLADSLVAEAGEITNT